MRRRTIFYGDDPIDYIETCTYCKEPARFSGTCLKHYADRMTREHLSNLVAQRKILKLILPCLLPVRRGRQYRTTLTTYHA